MLYLLVGLVPLFTFCEKNTPIKTPYHYNQATAFAIYHNYALTHFKKQEPTKIPKLDYLKPVVYGSYQGAKEGAVTVGKIAGAGLLSHALVSGMQYFFPSLFTPIQTIDKNGQVGFAPVDLKLYATGMAYFLKAWLPESMTSYNPLEMKTMEQKDVLKVIPMDSIKRHAEPIIHTGTAGVISAIRDNLKSKNYDALQEQSGIYIFHGESGSGKTESVKSAVARLYDSLPTKFKDEVIFVECSLKNVNSGIKNESAKNVAKLEEFFINVLKAPNKGKKIRAFILISNEVKLQDRSTLKDDEESKKIIESYLELFEKYRDIGARENACILHFITTNSSLEEFDDAIQTRMEAAVHFQKPNSERFKKIINEIRQESVAKRGIQLITTEDTELFHLFTNLRTLPKVENHLYRNWGSDPLIPKFGLTTIPVQFNHAISSALIQNYSKKRTELEKEVNNLQGKNHSVLLNHTNQKSLNYQEMDDRWQVREECLKKLESSHQELAKSTSNIAYQAAVKAYLTKIKNVDSEIPSVPSFYTFVKDEYRPDMPRFNLFKRAIFRIENRFLGKEFYNLEELREGIIEHHHTVINQSSERSKNLINAYKVDNATLEFIKVGNSKTYAPTASEKQKQPQSINALNNIFAVAASVRQAPNDAQSITDRTFTPLQSLAKENKLLSDKKYEDLGKSKLFKLKIGDEKDEQID